MADPRPALELDRDAPHPERLSLRAIASQIGDEFFSLDRGLPWTFAQLTARPGWVLRRYFDQRDARLTKPLRYFLITLTVAGLLFAWSGFAEGFAAGFRNGAPRASVEGGLGAHVLALFSRPEITITLGFVPLGALLQRRLLRNYALNGAEAVAGSAYLVGHGILLAALACCVLRSLPVGPWIFVGFFGPLLLWPAWGFARAAGRGVAPLLRAATGAVAGLVLGLLVSMIVGAAMVTIERKATSAAHDPQRPTTP